MAGTRLCAAGRGCSSLALILWVFGATDVLPCLFVGPGLILVALCVPSWRRGGFLGGSSITWAFLP